jgi:transposase
MGRVHALAPEVRPAPPVPSFRQLFRAAGPALSAHSLAALAAEVLGADPFSGAVLVFRSRRTDRIKILLWDGSGLVLVWKQLEGSAFRWPAVVDGVVRLTPVEFAALFDGLDWRRVQALREIPTPSAPA